MSVFFYENLYGSYFLNVRQIIIIAINTIHAKTINETLGPNEPYK